MRRKRINIPADFCTSLRGAVDGFFQTTWSWDWLRLAVCRMACMLLQHTTCKMESNQLSELNYQRCLKLFAMLLKFTLQWYFLTKKEFFCFTNCRTQIWAVCMGNNTWSVGQGTIFFPFLLWLILLLLFANIFEKHPQILYFSLWKYETL